MNPRLPFRLVFSLLTLVALCFLLSQSTASTQTGSATLTVRGGLQIATFGTTAGTIRIYLPDDIRPGDSISGTISVEPTGPTDDERATNEKTLRRQVFTLGDLNVPVERPTFRWTPTVLQPNAPVRYELKLFDVMPSSERINIGSIQLLPSGAVVTPDPKTTTGAIVTPNKTNPKGSSRAIVTPIPKMILPTIGQEGRPVEITGPFDGSFDNTSLRIRGTEVPILAESPRKAIFEAPRAIVGETEITLKEGNGEFNGSYRNVGVRLSAPKTSLMKGEKTMVTVAVSGLDGITNSVSLQLEATGVIAMDGGNLQSLEIPPTAVTNGVYSVAREITGLQPGSFNMVATVVVGPFDICLQDENVPATRLLFNSVTGDYTFYCSITKSCPGLEGSGRVVRNACVINLDHTDKDRRVVVVLDGCIKSGTAEIETPQKTKFTITDRNVTDNNCSTR